MVPPLRLPAALLGVTALLVTAFVLTACEDKDPLVDGSPTAQQAQRQQDAAGSDEQYVKDLCTAVDRFQDDFSKALGSPTASDEADVLTQLLKAMGPPAEQLANDLDKANPPADVQEWHDKAVEQLHHVADELQSGKGLDELQALGESPFPPPPAAPAERLAGIAMDTPECNGVNPFAP